MKKFISLIRGRGINYFSYFLLIILMTIIGAKSFIRPIYLTVIDSNPITGKCDDLYLYIFSFGFCSFAFGLGGMTVSLVKLLTNWSKLGNPFLIAEIKEYIFMGSAVVIGALLVLLLLYFQ
ncbi:hypothetical protein AYI92_03470 [Shewanella xiamenensis]|nr:hypothetical protein AYI90_03840 [Shewanella xiamenensis]TVL23040.1 hypothetical protein AYI91_04550 [Shewanella xiamenensis]TVL28505.1 hypothetical protein AYI92_03470 [Shewanella xiamenensis]TVL36968.1 hypothetical protein AYI93_03955 [Shewanella xiamenensis]TVP04618.1 hypothetical protein AYI89_03950 [Shewanella xiamenensis]